MYLRIDTYNKRLLHVGRVKRIQPDEVFFAIPGIANYALSNYGRLHRKTPEGAWHKVPIEKNICDCYSVWIEEDSNYRMIPVVNLMKRVFFPNEKGKLYKLNGKEKYPYHIKNLVFDKTQGENELLLFTDRPIVDWLAGKYNGMYVRATNEGFKRRNPQYKNTIMSEEWKKHPDICKQYLLDISYYHPENLDVDKDLVSFGTVDEYKAGNVILLPSRINNMITYRNGELGYGIREKILKNGDKRYTFSFPIRTDQSERGNLTFDNYEEALVMARQKRYEFYHNVVEEEWELGCMPEYILDLLESLAEGTRTGNVKLREPSEEILKNMGVIG